MRRIWTIGCLLTLLAIAPGGAAQPSASSLVEPSGDIFAGPICRSRPGPTKIASVSPVR